MGQEIVGKYKLGDVIKETANSILYKATRQNDNGEFDELYYAIKEYRAGLYTEELVKREKSIAHIIENNSKYSVIIPILESFSCDGKTYVVMQFRKNGMFLSEIIEQVEKAYKDDSVRLPLDSQMVILLSVLDSLDKLHNCIEDGSIGVTGYIHNDVHPGNIFFENIDFEDFVLYSNDIKKAKEYLGTAKFIDLQNAVPLGDGDASSTIPDSMRYYTHGYTAPEKVGEREVTAVSVSSDIYSVAAVAARLFVGGELGELDTDFRDVLEAEWYNTVNSGVQNSYKKLIDIGLKYESKYRFLNSKSMKKSLEGVMNYYQALKTNDLYTLLGTAFDMSMSFDELGLTVSDFDTEVFEFAVNRLNQETYTETALYDRCVYVFNGLWKLKPNLVAPKIHNKLINAGIACYNRYGRHRDATRLADQVVTSAFSLDEYIGFNIRMAEAYKDEMQYKKAYDMAKASVEALEKLREAKRDIAVTFDLDEDMAAKDVMLGRAYSAMGRYMTILGMDGGLDYLEKALEQFEQGNKMITYYHILQYAIYKKDKPLYERYAALYFGDEVIFKLEDAKASSMYLMTLAKNVNREGFKLLAFLKGVDAFYSDRLDDFTFQYESLLSQGIREGTAKLYHPVELIWKYTGILYFKKTRSVDDKLARFFRYSTMTVGRSRINRNKPLDIMMLISYQTTWEFNKLRGVKDKNVRLIDNLKRHCLMSDWDVLWQRIMDTDSLDMLLSYEEM